MKSHIARYISVYISVHLFYHRVLGIYISLAVDICGKRIVTFFFFREIPVHSRSSAANSVWLGPFLKPMIPPKPGGASVVVCAVLTHRVFDLSEVFSLLSFIVSVSQMSQL
jgi:hypothetical protein